MRVALDSKRPDGTSCAGGEVYLGSTCQDLNLTDASEDACRDDCGPGFYCDRLMATCAPILLSLHQDDCSTDVPCRGLCFNGECRESLDSTQPPTTGFIHCGDIEGHGGNIIENGSGSAGGPGDGAGGGRYPDGASGNNDVDGSDKNAPNADGSFQGA